MSAASKVVAAARLLHAHGLNIGTSGNVSVRLPSGEVLITPSSLSYDRMEPADVVRLAPDGTVLAGRRRPSSEYQLHLAIYAAHAEIGAVAHTHPTYATMFACAGRSVPAIVDEALMYVGGPVPVADYAASGTPQLGVNAAALMGDLGSCLLANHGMVTAAAELDAAVAQAELVEKCAHIALGADLLGGARPVPKDAADLFAGRYRRGRARSH